MVIWASEEPSGIWSPTVRVGDVGGQLGGSGKNRKTVKPSFSNFCFSTMLIILLTGAVVDYLM